MYKFRDHQTNDTAATPRKRMKTESNQELLDLRALVQGLVSSTIETAYQENHNKGLQRKIDTLQLQLTASEARVNRLQLKLENMEKVCSASSSTIPF
jgi:hypothetical protein